MKKRLLNFQWITPNIADEKISIEIDESEEQEYQVKIKDVWMSIEDLIWLQQSITEALTFIKKETGGKKWLNKRAVESFLWNNVQNVVVEMYLLNVNVVYVQNV